MSPTPIRDARLGTTHIPDRDLLLPRQEKENKNPQVGVAKSQRGIRLNHNGCPQKKKIARADTSIKVWRRRRLSDSPEKTGPRKSFVFFFFSSWKHETTVDFPLFFFPHAQIFPKRLQIFRCKNQVKHWHKDVTHLCIPRGHKKSGIARACSLS